MYDGGKIIIGLVIFLVLLTFPVWYNMGKAAYQEPELQLPKDEEQCIEPTLWIRENHMELLNTWRDKVVRENQTLYINSRGEKIAMSLQQTCMQCHTSKQEFCDKCHNSASVTPYCWDCHIAPEEVSNAK